MPAAEMTKHELGRALRVAYRRMIKLAKAHGYKIDVVLVKVVGNSGYVASINDAGHTMSQPRSTPVAALTDLALTLSERGDC